MNLGQWNQREATLEQENRFRRMIALHSLTDAWVKAITPKVDRPYQMERMARVTLNPNLWLFEKTRLDDLPLELNKLVGSQTIDSFLNELNTTIWIIQLSTLENVFAQSKNPEEVESVLQKASWNHGKSFAELNWKDAKIQSLYLAYQAFIETHFYSENAFIPERTTPSEFSFIWKKSPLQNSTLRNSPQVNILRKLHEEWIRGFFYSLSRNIKVNSEELSLMDENVVRFTLLLTY